MSDLIQGIGSQSLRMQAFEVEKDFNHPWLIFSIEEERMAQIYKILQDHYAWEWDISIEVPRSLLSGPCTIRIADRREFELYPGDALVFPPEQHIQVIKCEWGIRKSILANEWMRRIMKEREKW